MMSVEMKRVHAVAEELSKTRRSAWHCVMILHEEGTTLFFRNAYLVRYHDPQHGDWGASEHPGEWIMVFTEHHGFHVYPVDDLSWFQELQFVNSERFFATLEDLLEYKTKHPEYPYNEEHPYCHCGEDIVFDKKENAEFCQTCGKEISGTRYPPKKDT
jgi:hypothetical protein